MYGLKLEAIGETPEDVLRAVNEILHEIKIVGEGTNGNWSSYDTGDTVDSEFDFDNLDGFEDFPFSYESMEAIRLAHFTKKVDKNE